MSIWLSWGKLADLRHRAELLRLSLFCVGKLEPWEFMMVAVTVQACVAC